MTQFRGTVGMMFRGFGLPTGVVALALVAGLSAMPSARSARASATSIPAPAPAEAAITASTTSHAPAASIANPDFTRGETVPENATHDWNLGPTGARGWMYANKMETSEARQILVTTVDPGSPADGILQPGDVILGVGRQRFREDPRTELGRAIGLAEAGNGRLALQRWRDGRTSRVRLPLPAIGAYADTAPFGCPKSKRIFDDGCVALAERMAAAPDDGNPIERCLNALALLASNRPEYLPLIRHQVEWASGYSDLQRRDLHSWWYGPVNMLLAEYVLVTGDRQYMPQLERITMEIVNGQSPVGSWGHRFVQPNGRLAGYGMMNAPSLPLAVSLILAREAGVENPALDTAIERSARLVRFYVGKGSIPYGDHHPWIDTHDDNGKNGIAAVMFDLLGDVDAATYFSRMSVASHGPERDEGHTGNFFNMLWAMPGVALSGPEATGAWMEEFGWSYDLARRWDGTFQHQGPPAVRPDSYHEWDSTGAYLLAYAQPRRTLALTGRGPRRVPQVDAREATELIDLGRGWSPRLKLTSYADRSRPELMAGLQSWSPVARERAALEFARRGDAPTSTLVRMLTGDDLYARLGAAQAIIHLGPKAAEAVPALRQTLQADDLWLRVKAAEALGAIGRPAVAALPDMLEMLAESDIERDPRGMEQRYLCFTLFNRRGGMLGRSLDGVDRDLLQAAVEAGLRNEDGRARGSIGSVYENLSFEELEPLLPAILQAVREPAPSGIMFADEIRLSGLELLARHRVEEALPWCIDLIDPDRWGMGNRVERCIAALRPYGGSAASQIPKLQSLEAALAKKGWKPDRIKELGIADMIRAIEADANPPAMRSVGSAESNE
ncbi:MAG: DUF6288 domain-containing protein [Phycisphaerales bacterium]